MATIKSYTELSQSKVLAEILPLESADMWWAWHSSPLSEGHYSDFPMFCKPICNPDESVPCWSLASLLGVIPQEIFDGEYIINITEGIDNKWIITYDHRENRNHSYYGLSTGADNLVDACTDIIIKLKERNII